MSPTCDNLETVGGGGIMIWGEIVGDRIIGPFKVDDGVNLTLLIILNFWTRISSNGIRPRPDLSN